MAVPYPMPNGGGDGSHLLHTRLYTLFSGRDGSDLPMHNGGRDGSHLPSHAYAPGQLWATAEHIPHVRPEHCHDADQGTV